MRAPARFTAVASVVLDASGDGSATVAPAGLDWLVMHTRVSTSTDTLIPGCDIHLNGESSAYEGTLTGSGDESDTRHLVAAGESIEARWTGGDAGATATLRVSGVQIEPGHGIRYLVGG